MSRNIKRDQQEKILSFYLRQAFKKIREKKRTDLEKILQAAVPRDFAFMVRDTDKKK